MKSIIIALNSKYIHSSLAVWYLKAICGNECGEVKVMEFTINESMDSILADIYREKADIAAFSCYIWNIDHVLKLVRNLKRVLPHIKIVLGGPEVSFDTIQLMKENPSVDFVIAGEGERCFEFLLKYLNKSVGGTLNDINGLFYKKEGDVVSNKPCSFIEDLDLLPSPYTEEMLSSLENRIVYFESSRGCPFSCSYCLSSTFEGVRYFSLDRVKHDLIRLIEAGVKQVKFVDRTFNCNRARAKEIFRFILQSPGETNFHFEAAADLFDDEMLDILSEAPAGRIQFEIGIQSTNPETLEAIDRKTNLDRVFYNIKRLWDMGNIHLHLDLIAGLPHEGYAVFKNSFNQVYNLRPHQLQLGFLKMLKGSKIRTEAELHGYSFREYPPYEVLYNSYITFDELLDLKGIEELVERYYNSGRFSGSLNFAAGRLFESPFDFYHEFYLYCTGKGYLKWSLANRELYTVLLEFFKGFVSTGDTGIFNELLKLDFLSSDNSGNLPAGIEREVVYSFKDRCFEFLKDEGNVTRYLPEFEGIPAKQIFKNVHFEVFNYDVTQKDEDYNYRKARTVVLFNYSKRNRVTGLYKSMKVDL